MKKFIAILATMMFTSAFVSAEYNFDGSVNELEWGIMTTSAPISVDTVWNSSEAFLEAEWKICKVATDGCNTVMIVDWKLGWMTKMYCEDVYGENGKESWYCKEYISNAEETENTDNMTNDERFHVHIKNTLDSKYQDQVAKAINQFKTKTTSYSTTKLNSTIDILAGALSNMVFGIVIKYPADAALPTDVNNQYLMLELLRFELLDLKK